MLSLIHIYTAPAIFDWSKQRVLVAEDNELNREIVTEILRQMGAQVLSAVNGAEAVRVFQQTGLYLSLIHI